jgi:serine phosphatase RsbU (regulator of sigma subunit)
MATLRSSVRAFATETDSPAEILERLARLVDLQRDGHFATVLCVAFSLDDHALTVASAGHPSPLLVCEGRAEFVAAPVGTPIGVAGGTSYSATTIQVTPGVTLLMFTDGLFERRGESIDLGMERLRRAVSSRRSSSVEALVDGVVEAQINDIVHDDAAFWG